MIRATAEARMRHVGPGMPALPGRKLEAAACSRTNSFRSSRKNGTRPAAAGQNGSQFPTLHSGSEFFFSGLPDRFPVWPDAGKQYVKYLHFAGKTAFYPVRRFAALSAYGRRIQP